MKKTRARHIPFNRLSTVAIARQNATDLHLNYFMLAALVARVIIINIFGGSAVDVQEYKNANV